MDTKVYRETVLKRAELVKPLSVREQVLRPALGLLSDTQVITSQVITWTDLSIPVDLDMMEHYVGRAIRELTILSARLNIDLDMALLSGVSDDIVPRKKK